MAVSSDKLDSVSLAIGKILTDVRVQIARNYLSQRPPPPLARLSYLLGYSEASAASRFIKIHMGKSARDIVRELRRGQPTQPHACRS